MNEISDNEATGPRRVFSHGRPSFLHVRRRRFESDKAAVLLDRYGGVPAMSTLSIPFPSAVREKANPSRSGVRDPYATEEQTQALLRRGADYRRERISASDMVTTEEAAELGSTSRVTINAWIKSGRCIGLAHLRRGFKLPRWQFEPYVFAVIQPVSKALGTTDGWQLLSFLETPQPALDDLTPRLALERGVSAERIVELATAQRH